MKSVNFMPLSPGTRVGPYEILAWIGAGGMGEVYRARDTALKRDVALKVLPAAFARDLGRMARFQLEAEVLASLNHPHIGIIYGLAESEGLRALVMEFVDGSPLRGPLPPEKAVPLALQIVSALEQAHGKGIVHRDLKPANILVGTAGVKLLDFGLAKLLRERATIADSDVTETIAGTVLGTPAYMSPEQAAGKTADVRSDIFSFGAVLYELLSGRRAFPGDTQVTTMAAVLHKEPEPLDAPPDIVRIVTRCLRKNPAERFQTAVDLKAALEAAGSRQDRLPHMQPSIAVLPFVNMSPDKENEYFSDGLSEEIINALTKVPGLRVIARTSAFRFRGEQDLRKVGETLQVSNVLEGSVRRAGNRLRITAQLINVADDSHLWSERYDREMADIFAIQDEIAAAITSQLKVSLTGPAPAAKRPANLAAYEAVLEGWHHLHKTNPAGLAKGLDCFERALVIDPGYAPAHEGVASYYTGSAIMGLASGRELLPKARAAAERALDLDPAIALAHAVLGFVAAGLDYDWAASGQHFNRVLALDPSAAGARRIYACWYLRPLGRLEEALAELERCLELDPLAVLARVEKANTLLYLRRYDAAAEAVQRALDLDPSHMVGLAVLTQVRLAQKRFEEARVAAELAAQYHGRWPVPLGSLASVHALAGRTEQARTVLAEIRAFPGLPSPFFTAQIYCCLGETDAAFEQAGKAIEERLPAVATFIRLQPLLDPLRSDPRYQALLKRMNLA